MRRPPLGLGRTRGEDICPMVYGVLFRGGSFKMSAKSKGNQYEIEVKKILETDGWKVFRQHRKPIFIKGHMVTMGADIFGCDIVAKKEGEIPRWIQVSTVTNKLDKIRQVMEHPWNWEHEKVEVWCRVERKKEFRVFVGPEFGEVL
jgi:hypothetical protein